MARPLTADDLLAGAATSHTVDVPAALLGATEEGNGGGAVAGQVVLRPLTVRDVQRVTRAAKEQRLLTSILMVQQSLTTPQLSIEQVSGLPAGLVQFLLARVNAISGLTMGNGELERAVRAPIARACFVLAREFGWTAAECSELTLGQILLYLEMLARDGDGHGGEEGDG